MLLEVNIRVFHW